MKLYRFELECDHDAIVAAEDQQEARDLVLDLIRDHTWEEWRPVVVNIEEITESWALLVNGLT